MSTMLLIQSGEPGFELTPSVTAIDFEYDGELTITGNNTNTFLVNPGLSTDGTTVNQWKYVLEGDKDGHLKYCYLRSLALPSRSID